LTASICLAVQGHAIPPDVRADFTEKNKAGCLIEPFGAFRIFVSYPAAKKRDFLQDTGVSSTTNMAKTRSEWLCHELDSVPTSRWHWFISCTRLLGCCTCWSETTTRGRLSFTCRLWPPESTQGPGKRSYRRS